MIRKEQECKIEYREHMRDGDGTVQITNFITGPAELNEKGRLFAKMRSCFISSRELLSTMTTG